MYGNNLNMYTYMWLYATIDMSTYMQDCLINANNIAAIINSHAFVQAQ